MTKRMVSFDDVTGNLTPTVDAALSATYAPLGRAIGGSRMVALGDSITATGDLEPGLAGGITVLAADSWVTHAAMMSGQRMTRIRNAGISGNTSAQMLARFDTDVTPFTPNLVPVLAGTNDIIGGVTTFATYKANMTAIVAKIRAIGALPVLCTILPNNTAGNHAKIIQFNNWLRIFAAAQGLPLLDFYKIAVNPATGYYNASMNTGDGVHPGIAGEQIMGQYASDTLSPWLPPEAPPLAMSDADPHNGGTPVLLTQFMGLFTGAPSSGLAAPWVWYSQPSGAVSTVVTDSAVLGNMQKVTCTATATDAMFYRAPSVGNAGNNAMVVGDRILFSGIVTTSGIGARVLINFTGGSPGSCQPISTALNVTRGQYYAEFTIPAGTTGIEHILVAKAGTGYAQFGQITMYDQTTQALV